jgi:hypothetical protein
LVYIIVTSITLIYIYIYIYIYNPLTKKQFIINTKERKKKQFIKNTKEVLDKGSSDSQHRSDSGHIIHNQFAGIGPRN